MKPALAAHLPSVDASAWRHLTFISDLHLQASQQTTFQVWRQAMQTLQTDALFILGDLFEAWVGADVLHHPLGVFEQSCAQALTECTASKPVFFVCGNRDFLIGPAFFHHTGVQALSEPCRVDSRAGPLLLSHGDTLCTDDHDYLAFRAQVRNPDWQNTFLAQPLPERMAQARAMRAQSQANLPPQRTLLLYGLRDKIIPQQPVCDWLTNLNSVASVPLRTDVVIYKEGWHMLTRQLSARETLEDIARWIQNIPQTHLLNPFQAQEVVCKVK